MTPTQLILALVIVSGIIIILLTGGLEKKNKPVIKGPIPKAQDPNISPEPQIAPEEPVNIPSADEESLVSRKANAEKNKAAKPATKKVVAETKSAKPGRSKKSKGDDLILS